MNIGKAIRLCRINRGLTLQELVDLSGDGISYSYLSLIERGKRNLSVSKLQQVALALNIPDFLLVFLATESKDGIPQELVEKLSFEALKVLK